ncbi:MAG TPA: outer membrane beta-barrel protein, partial [Gallionella sp.]
MLDDQLTFEGKNGFSSSLSTPVIYKLNLGYQINNELALEGGFIGSTSATYSASGGNLTDPITAQARLSGWTFVAVGMMPLANQFSVLGKLGMADIQVTAAVTGFGYNTYLSGIKSDITYGVGAKYDLTDTLTMRLDLDSYNVGSFASSSRCSIWTVGVGYKY